MGFMFLTLLYIHEVIFELLASDNLDIAKIVP